MYNKDYRLQVVISAELSEKLKRMAKEDDRTLRAFCKRILESYVNERESDNSESMIKELSEKVNIINSELSVEINKNEIPEKKSKVGALRPPTK